MRDSVDIFPHVYAPVVRTTALCSATFLHSMQSGLWGLLSQVSRSAHVGVGRMAARYRVIAWKLDRLAV